MVLCRRGVFFVLWHTTKPYFACKKHGHRNLPMPVVMVPLIIYLHWKLGNKKDKTRCPPLIVTVKHKLSESFKHLSLKQQFILFKLLPLHIAISKQFFPPASHIFATETNSGLTGVKFGLISVKTKPPAHKHNNTSVCMQYNWSNWAFHCLKTLCIDVF